MCFDKEGSSLFLGVGLGLGGPSHNGDLISSQAMLERTSSLCLSLGKR
jgi:hypothetical protein